MKKPMPFHSGSNREELLANYQASDEDALVLKTTSADGKWICEFHHCDQKPLGEWFAISKSGEILATGSKSTVNHTLHKKGFKHDCWVAHGRWITLERAVSRLD